MESKHHPGTGQDPESPSQLGELSSRLSDIELKIDHLIERIKDSLHRLHAGGQDDWGDEP